MSFAAPEYLLVLLLAPVLAAAYVRHGRARRAAAEAFVAAPLAASVAPVRPRWRRHVPVAAFALAFLALGTALARPQAAVSVPDERASIVLATDHSGSMQATDVAPNRLAAVRTAAGRFLDEVPEEIRVGLVAFNQRARTLQTPTTDRTAVRDALGALRPSGGTATGEALAAALGTLERQKGPDGKLAPGAVVLLSDGKSVRGRDPLELARRARRLGIPVYTVALGTAQGTIEVDGRRRTVPPDPAAMRAIAQISGGRTFAAGDARALKAVYEQLGSKVGRRTEQREITAGFAGGALALLALGALASLHWFRRLI